MCDSFENITPLITDSMVSFEQPGFGLMRMARFIVEHNIFYTEQTAKHTNI